jgi:hypothetical protein
MGNKQSNDNPNLSKEKLPEVYFDPPTFVQPDLCQELPMLENYCGGESISDSYHCENLQRILFCAANSQYKGHQSFDSIARKVSTDWDKIYHIKHLMEYNQHPATIYNTIKEFNEKCNELENKQYNQ